MKILLIFSMLTTMIGTCMITYSNCPVNPPCVCDGINYLCANNKYWNQPLLCEENTNCGDVNYIPQNLCSCDNIFGQ